MATVTLEAHFEGASKVALSKKLQTVYFELIKNYKNICEYLIIYEGEKRQIMPPDYIDASTGDIYEDKKAQAVLSFFSNSCPYSLGIDELPKDFYKKFFKLFPDISISVSLFESYGGSLEIFAVTLTKHGLQWEERDFRDEGSEDDESEAEDDDSDHY